MNNNVVQTSVFPKISLCAKKGLYFRSNSLVEVSLIDEKVTLFQGGLLVTNTYFNSVSINKLKKYANIEKLSFRINFSGHLKLTWKVKALQRGERIVQENILRSNDELTESTIELPFWQDLLNGILFFEVQSLDNSQINSFQYVTSQKPVHDIQLGLVITHFNRQGCVVSAIDKLKKELLKDSFWGNQIRVCVVDNSRNLPNIDGVDIIKNPNLGGSGGFSRGLLHFEELGFSHCLFMDDDVSCEIESIRRTLFYLAYSSNDNMAISGAMFREIAPNMQHENGAIFNGLCVSVGRHFNLLKTKDILLNETEGRIDYGAWWFFAFPIKHVKYWAFPFFVRGDDIGFSLANQFDIVTVNGIATWQADFAYKAGPLQLYLDQRNHLMHFLHDLVVGGSNKMFFRATYILFMLHILSYQYESARACTIAIQDILKGPDFWRNNADLQKKSEEILAMIEREKTQPISNELKDIAVTKESSESTLIKIIRLLSLNGHLIPSIFFTSTPMWAYKSYGVRLREIFLHKEAIYFTDTQAENGIVLKHSKKLFFKYAWGHLCAVCKLYWNAKKLKREYIATYPELASKDFWQKQFDRADI